MKGLVLLPAKAKNRSDGEACNNPAGAQKRTRSDFKDAFYLIGGWFVNILLDSPRPDENPFGRGVDMTSY